jgi:acetyl-CoA C-acetyltransferase
MSPPELMAEAARRAALDSGAGPTLLEKIDYLGVVSKHAAGVYSTRAPDPDRDLEPARRSGEPEPAALLALEAEGRATVETYTVLFGRGGAPSRGIVVGRLEDGRRFLSNTLGEPGLAETLAAAEAIGLQGVVSRSGGINVFDPS